MPKPKRKAHELTTHEAMHKLFPKKAIRHLKKAAGTDEPPIKKPTEKPTT
jgi:hypothetical protein